jgi:hypothetical protein
VKRWLRLGFSNFASGPPRPPAGGGGGGKDKEESCVPDADSSIGQGEAYYGLALRPEESLDVPNPVRQYHENQPIKNIISCQ